MVYLSNNLSEKHYVPKTIHPFTDSSPRAIVHFEIHMRQRLYHIKSQASRIQRELFILTVEGRQSPQSPKRTVQTSPTYTDRNGRYEHSSTMDNLHGLVSLCRVLYRDSRTSRLPSYFGLDRTQYISGRHLSWCSKVIGTLLSDDFNGNVAQSVGCTPFRAVQYGRRKMMRREIGGIKYIPAPTARTAKWN